MKALITTNYVVDEFGAAQLDSFDEIDIPDGCVLAMVNAAMTNERVCDDKFEYTYAPFARVIQEVKL